MIKIDLIDKSNSNIDYDIITFPDGEKHIKILSELPHKESAIVITRIKSADDLFILLQIGDILNRHGISFAITISYLLGMRMDRVMSFNRAYSLKIIADAINTLNADCVFIIEPHSTKATTLINNSIPIKNRFIPKIYMEDALACIVFPDAGASDRYMDALSTLDIDWNVVNCEKVRNADNDNIDDIGFSNPQVIENAITKGCRNFYIIDDLCDSGNTLANIHKLLEPYIKEYDIAAHIYVTHAVNKEGIKKIAALYDSVMISNSYADWYKTDIMDLPNVTVVNVNSDYYIQ